MEAINKLIKKLFNRETISYLVAGVTTTLVNVGLYSGLLALGMDYRWANLIALISAKAYAYIVNKLFVFRTHRESAKELLKEMVRFIFARGFTGLLDYFGLIFAVEICGFPQLISKYALQIIVIILNYILGKLHVFKGTSTAKESSDKGEAAA